jgi:nitroreductase
MSGANSQPWEYIVVKDPQVKKRLFRAYTEVNAELSTGWSSSASSSCAIRVPDDRGKGRRAAARAARLVEAPALIVVVGDGRRQWGTVQGAHYLRPRPVAPHRRAGEHRAR